MWFFALFLAQDVSQQDAVSQADRIRAAMEASLEQQRASVRRQAQAAKAFMSPAMIPWTPPQPAASEPPPCDPIPEPQLMPMIDQAASKSGVDPAIVREVARQESGFRPCAVSPKGAEGLMQLMPSTQLQLRVSDPFNANESLEAGSKLLKQLIDRYNGNLPLALSAYNAGAGRVDKTGAIPEIPETQIYVANILSRLIP